jgi:hypothetical protein
LLRHQRHRGPPCAGRSDFAACDRLAAIRRPGETVREAVIRLAKGVFRDGRTIRIAITPPP